MPDLISNIRFSSHTQMEVSVLILYQRKPLQIPRTLSHVPCVYSLLQEKKNVWNVLLNLSSSTFERGPKIISAEEREGEHLTGGGSGPLCDSSKLRVSHRGREARGGREFSRFWGNSPSEQRCSVLNVKVAQREPKDERRAGGVALQHQVTHSEYVVLLFLPFCVSLWLNFAETFWENRHFAFNL